MSRKVPNEIDERIEFAEALLQSAKLMEYGLEHTLETIAKERARLDAWEAQARKDAERAPAQAERAEKMLWAAKRAKQQILNPSGPPGPNKERRQERLEAKVAAVNAKRAELAKLEADLEDES